jgi:hypothetical protein
MILKVLALLLHALLVAVMVRIAINVREVAKMFTGGK